MNDFITQGGFAAYVWPAYGISALALALLGFWIGHEYRQAKAKLAALATLERDAP
ncbi:MAG: heme exporter protein CcmD [Rhizomicrobium sp.]|nr:heme exporter protein CcmD [Rhizomicrobium sp.]